MTKAFKRPVNGFFHDTDDRSGVIAAFRRRFSDAGRCDRSLARRAAERSTGATPSLQGRTFTILSYEDAF